MRTLTVLTAMAALLAIQPVLAEDIWDPPWVENPSDPQWSGGFTTHQVWEFDENSESPVILENPFTSPTRQPYVQVSNGAYPDPVPGPDGTTEINTWHIGPGGGTVTIWVPNNPDPNWLKVIFIQITSDKGQSDPTGPHSNPPGTTSYPKPAINHDGTGWYTYTARIDIPGNPPEEFITYTFPESTNISEIVVDTICVSPEPATLGLLVLGGVGLAASLRRRRR